ncbi:MAG: choice-of-anchor B family protein, partial [Rhodothermales bacterium]|nr:choice-of-anchor B family protein [Rhodothermales bacterium]
MRRIFPFLAALLLAAPALGTPANDDAAFGGAVAVSGETVFIGEPRSFSQPGRVHVFEQTADGTWETVAVLAADDGAIGDGFGDALAAAAGAVLVGAPQANDDRGAAYLFVRRADGAWVQAARLAAPDAAEGDAFGATVAFDGTHAYVGTPGANDRAGAVHVFAPAGDGWAHHTTLTASDAAEGQRFGSAMAVEGPRLAVGAPFHTQATGAVYLFEAAGDGWAERLQLAGAEANHRFGMAVALNGSEVAVAAPFANELAGLVQIFDVDGEGAWSEIARFEPIGEEPARSFFGQALHFEGDNGWIGAPGAGGFAGTLHHYHRIDGSWMHADEVAGDGVEPGDSFAGSFAIDGDLAVAGASRADYGEGMATILEREGNQWSAQTLVFAEAEPLPPIVGGEVNCTEGEAAAFGCGRVDLVAFVPNDVMEMNRGVRLNDVWGWTDAETGTEYALIGHMEGTAFLDLSDPTHPAYLGTLPRTEGSPGSTWRDMKVYADHVFIVADGAGEHGMQIFDLTRLRDVEDGPVTFEADAHYDQIASAHNIVINEETATAYIVGSGGGGETCGGGLHMVDVSTPQSPTFAGCFGHE